jgi:ABC-2 type transport system permease protein
MSERRIRDPRLGGKRAQLREMVASRFREWMREPEALFWSFGFPILLAIGLGLAFRERTPEPAQVGVVVSDGSVRESALLDSLASHRGIAVRRLADDSAAARALRTGRVALVISLRDGAAVFRYDETRPESRMARLEADAALQRSSGRADAVAVTEEQVRERGSRYIDFLIPGLLGMTIMGGGMWGIGYSIVDARRRHLLKRLVATPMSRTLYLVSFLVNRFLFLAIEVATVLGVGVLVFGVPVHGSVLLLALAITLSAVTFSAIGLLAAARPKTIEGASGLMNLTMMPMWVLSGIFFSSTNFPESIQPLIQALPLTAAIDAMRGTMLLGAGWRELAPEFGIMSAWLVVSFAAALRLFRWR